MFVSKWCQRCKRNRRFGLVLIRVEGLHFLLSPLRPLIIDRAGQDLLNLVRKYDLIIYEVGLRGQNKFSS